MSINICISVSVDRVECHHTMVDLIKQRQLKLFCTFVEQRTNNQWRQ